MSRAAFMYAVIAAFGACSDDATTVQAPVPGDPNFVRNPALDVSNVSKAGETRSHNVGRNCMECHQAKGPGKGRFTAAGTLYDDTTRAPVKSGKLELFDGPKPDAALIATLEVDGLGNFFTTEALPFPDKNLFPVVTSGSLRRAMPFPTISGACNQCHTRGNLVAVKP
jgi:hypothetical protein